MLEEEEQVLSRTFISLRRRGSNPCSKEGQNLVVKSRRKILKMEIGFLRYLIQIFIYLENSISLVFLLYFSYNLLLFLALYRVLKLVVNEISFKLSYPENDSVYLVFFKILLKF